MTNRTAALRYARALFDVGVKEKADLEQIEGSLAEFNTVVAGNRLLEKVLLNPAVPTPRKRAAVVELVTLAKVPSSVGKLLVLLAERDRLVLLPDLLDAFRQRLLDHRNVVRAEVTTATPLAADRVQAIEKSLEKATGRSVTLSTRVEPALIGGLVARLGSTVYDGSLTGKLAKMKQQLEERR